jgi:AhpD family alkylhydroperoxidase
MAIKYLASLDRRTADPLVTEILAQIRRDFGPISEPFEVQAPLPRVFAAAWACLREGVLCGEVPRRFKETVAVSISLANRCPYCVDAHSSLLHSSGGSAATWSLRHRGRDAIADPALRAVAEWAAATRSPGSPILADPPFGPAEAPEMVAAAACFHYINRLVTIFLGPSPFPTRARLFEAPILLFASRRFRSTIRRRLRPGESLPLMGPAIPLSELPTDLGWGRTRPEIGGPFGTMAAMLEEEIAEPLGGGAAEAVRWRIGAWEGEDLPLGNAWIDEGVNRVPERYRPAARLALLTALAPYRVGEAEVVAFRAGFPGDRALAAVTIWASFTAARRIASWLDPFLEGRSGMIGAHRDRALPAS